MKKPARSRRQSIGEGVGDGKQMRLQHAGDIDKDACHVSGPYDVVLMDMTLCRLLHALLQVTLLCSFNILCEDL